MRKILLALFILSIVSCSQPVEPAPVINNYYITETPPAPEPEPVAEPVVVEEAPPIIEAPREITDYERYALYVIDPTGTIFCEDHCEDYLAYGYASQAALFSAILPLYQLEAQQHGAGWQCISGALYPAI